MYPLYSCPFATVLVASSLLLAGCDNGRSDFERFESMIAQHWDNDRQAQEDARLELDYAVRHLN